jgi:hypothetical protein
LPWFKKVLKEDEGGGKREGEERDIRRMGQRRRRKRERKAGKERGKKRV